MRALGVREVSESTGSNPVQCRLDFLTRGNGFLAVQSLQSLSLVLRESSHHQHLTSPVSLPLATLSPPSSHPILPPRHPLPIATRFPCHYDIESSLPIIGEGG
ncbi:hypothetical protein E2C01_086936 [Portunus trituberculatus]|uniref:Uncharacterized protein n=1 Tax=Portunus trituberculatus TaxID=210409 RepID=A0A5B7JHQ7_PORTR|nr:hypothetical protein [Portunus trituberculatus]